MCDGLMVRMLNSGLSGLDSSTGHVHCVVFLGKTLYSHSKLLLNCMLGVTLLWTSIPSREVEILVVNETPVNIAETGIRTRSLTLTIV